MLVILLLQHMGDSKGADQVLDDLFEFSEVVLTRRVTREGLAQTVQQPVTTGSARFRLGFGRSLGAGRVFWMLSTRAARRARAICAMG